LQQSIVHRAPEIGNRMREVFADYIAEKNLFDKPQQSCESDDGA
jgi:hypothetical protein